MGAGARRASDWTIHDERVIDDTRRAVLSIADVELPDGVRFEQYVLRSPSAAMVIVLDDADRVLMMWRHRFIIDRWVWELPGGYLDHDEDPVVCAAREVEEETGWRPRSMEPLLGFQPMVGTIDQQDIIYLSRGADPTGTVPCCRLVGDDHGVGAVSYDMARRDQGLAAPREPTRLSQRRFDDNDGSLDGRINVRTGVGGPAFNCSVDHPGDGAARTAR
ncbi:NUDIX hydrolase [Micromonospora sp. LOL_015]|uniref:NUDIX hydrolase n=1 Tax=Micromonospora sp. LOL_015 TaxID=3345416 RepID=UPI003A8A9C7F